MGGQQDVNAGHLCSLIPSTPPSAGCHMKGGLLLRLPWERGEGKCGMCPWELQLPTHAGVVRHSGLPSKLLAGSTEPFWGLSFWEVALFRDLTKQAPKRKVGSIRVAFPPVLQSLLTLPALGYLKVQQPHPCKPVWKKTRQVFASSSVTYCNECKKGFCSGSQFVPLFFACLLQLGIVMSKCIIW